MPSQVYRLLIFFGVFALLFVLLHWVAKPESFGEYGHYRGRALAENVEREPHYAAVSVCAECHTDEAQEHKGGSHGKFSCQICHGAGGVHAEEPSAENIHKPDGRDLCLRCHEFRQARPVKFPQIVESEHAAGEKCITCHHAHAPNRFEGEYDEP